MTRPLLAEAILPFGVGCNTSKQPLEGQVVALAKAEVAITRRGDPLTAARFVGRPEGRKAGRQEGVHDP